MPGRIRLLGSSGDGHVAALASHVRQLQDSGAVLFITADRPFSSWVAPLANAGVDSSRLTIIDVVTAVSGQPASRPHNVLFLASPGMLETMILRIEKCAAASGARHVVLDSLNTLASYNGLAPVQEFAHYLANRLRASSIGGDLVVRDGQAGAVLRERVESFVDESLTLGTA